MELIRTLHRAKAQTSDIAFALNIARASVWYCVTKTFLPPSKRAAVVPPGLSEEAEAAVIKRRVLVQKLASVRYKKAGPAPNHWMWVGKRYPTSRSIKIALCEKYRIDVTVWTVRRDLMSIGMVAKCRSIIRFFFFFKKWLDSTHHGASQPSSPL